MEWMEQKQETNKRNFIKSSTTPIALRTERLSIVEEKNENKKKSQKMKKKKTENVSVTSVWTGETVKMFFQ